MEKIKKRKNKKRFRILDSGEICQVLKSLFQTNEDLMMGEEKEQKQRDLTRYSILIIKIIIILKYFGVPGLVEKK